jgi:threonine aldolase
LPLKPGLKKVEPVETIIIFEVFDEISVTQYCAKHKLIISNMGQGKLRLVTH